MFKHNASNETDMDVQFFTLFSKKRLFIFPQTIRIYTHVRQGICVNDINKGIYGNFTKRAKFHSDQGQRYPDYIHRAQLSMKQDCN